MLLLAGAPRGAVTAACLRVCATTLIPQRSVQQWMQRHVNDPYVKASRKQELRSRAAFKLKEMQEKYKILRRGDCVIDLGCAPGGWSEVAVQLVLSPQQKRSVAPQLPNHKETATAAMSAPSAKASGRVIGIDLRPIVPLSGLTFLQGDFTEAATQAALRQALVEGNGNGKVDVILSDMSPDLSGDKFRDHRRTLDMCYEVLAFADHVFTSSSANVTAGGGGSKKKKPSNRHTVLCKFFKGRDEAEFVAYVQARFTEVRVLKPKASRSESAEQYIFARDYVGEGGGKEGEESTKNE